MISMYRIYMEVYSGDILAYAKDVCLHDIKALIEYLSTESVTIHEVFTELNKAGSYKESPYVLTVCLYRRPRQMFDDDRLPNIFRLYMKKTYFCHGEAFDFADGLTIF